MSHYFTNDANLKSKKREFKYLFDNHEFIMNSDLGVFSKNGLDDGTFSFLMVLKKEHLEGRILDLGSGIGCLAITLGYLFPNCSIEGAEINKRAWELSKENCLLNNISNVKFIESDICSNIEGQFDNIVTNPPIRAGKEVIFEFFRQAKEHLVTNGNLYVVTRKSHGANSSMEKLRELFGNCTLLKKDKGYYIFKSTK